MADYSKIAPMDTPQSLASIKFTESRQLRHQPKTQVYNQSPPKLFRSQFQKFNFKQNQIQTRKFSELQQIFQKAVRKLINILKFYEIINEQVIRKSKLGKNELMYRRSYFLPFYPDDKILTVWIKFNKLNLFLCTIFYPLYISFIDYKIERYEWIVYIMVYFTVFFSLDVIMNFISCSIDENYKLIYKNSQIIKNYAKKWFIPDVLSIFPYELIFKRENNEVFTSQDVFQILRLLKIIKYFFQTKQENLLQKDSSNQDEDLIADKPIFELSLQAQQLINIVINTFLLVHIFGCLFYFAARYENFQSSNQTDIFDSEDFIQLYVLCLYWSVQTVTVVGYGDIIYMTSAQFNLCVIWMLIGVGFYSFTIGNISSIIADSETNAEQYEQSRLLEEFISQVHMPDKVIQDFQQFVISNTLRNPFWSTHSKNILTTLPSNLKRYLVLSACTPTLCKVQYFQLDLLFASDILHQMTTITIESENPIYLIGEPSNEIYYLISGEVRILNKQGQTLVSIVEGSIFGEIEAIEEIKRQNHCYASETSQILICPSKQYLDCLVQNEFLNFELNQLYLRRKLLISSQQQFLKSKQLEQQKRNLKQKKKVKQVKEEKTKKNFQKGRRKANHLTPDQVNDLNEQAKLITYLIGHKQQRRQQIQEKFRRIYQMVEQIIRMYRKIKNFSSLQLKDDVDFKKIKILFKNMRPMRSLIRGKSMMMQFESVCYQERKIQRVIDHDNGFLLLTKSKIKDIISYQSQNIIDFRLRKSKLKQSKNLQLAQQEIELEKQEEQKKIIERKKLIYNSNLTKDIINQLNKNLSNIQNISKNASLIKWEVLMAQETLEQDIQTVSQLINIII